MSAAVTVPLPAFTRRDPFIMPANSSTDANSRLVACIEQNFPSRLAYLLVVLIVQLNRLDVTDSAASVCPRHYRHSV